MQFKKTISGIAAVAAFAVAAPAAADTINLPAGGDLQAAIDAAFAGDIIQLEAGEYAGNIDYVGKDLAIIGVGDESVIRGDGFGPAVTFTNGEGPGAVLDSVLVTGGSALEGGGIYIHDASPTIVRNAIVGNFAAQTGSGIYSGGATADPLIANNLLAYNNRTGGDPHGIQIGGGAPMIINNTIARSDSNGIFITGNASAMVLNNIIARNGSRSAEFGRRGRGICDFTVGSVILYNDFFKNSKSALLKGGTDYRRIRGAQKRIGGPELEGNTDRSPRFVRRRLASSLELADLSDFDLRSNSRMVGAGHPDAAYFNTDGSRNTIGHSGGPLAVE